MKVLCLAETRTIPKEFCEFIIYLIFWKSKLFNFHPMSFPSVSPKQSFPALESEVLAYWKANNTFQKSIDSRPEDNPYRFYDGPPFITGTPHYGSLLSSIVKDVVGRYWTMRGKRVDRVWWWDCHGLPIEEKVQRKLGLKSNREIEERGVKEFIDGCYEYTAATSAEWDWYIDKIGRWVDMDRAYRTMDQDYMESVMWVFRQLWDKWLIYEGKRVSLYSWKLGTPISNFEVAMDDTYQEVNDPAITVKFRPEFTYGAFAFVTNSEWKLLLGKHKRSWTWKIPGGKFEVGETREQCLEREVLEETGIKISNYKPLNTSVEFFEWVAYYGYAYTVDVGDIKEVKNPEPDKFEEWKFFTFDEVQAMKNEIAKYDHEALEVFLWERDPILEIKDFSILAWTTTPWTIPANMALAVRNDIDYILVESNSEQYIVAKNRAESVFKGKGEYAIIREFKGSELVGLGYIPPFPEYYYQKNGEKNHKIYHADFITDTDGTGIGHEAPEFGDVDFQLAKKEWIFISEAMDEAGKYTAQIFDYEGTHYLNLEEPEKGANRINIERMKANNTLFKLESITHRVPFCPRSGTPLMQKAQASWFIDIQSQKEKLLKANEQINWFPEHLKFGRFAKGIESAPDWCISRTRYWWAPMPVWQNKDGSERVVVSSREEIFERNKPYGQLERREVDEKVKYFFKGGEFDGVEFNLHKPYIDSVFLAPNNSHRAKKVLGVHGFKRTESVVDFFEQTANTLHKNEIEVSCPIFEVGDKVRYENWEKIFLENIEGVDTVFAHSLGCRFSLDTIIKHQIPLKKLILIAPPEWKHPNLQEFYSHLNEDITQIRNFVDEVIILYSTDDKLERLEVARNFIEQLGCSVVKVDGYGHFNITECKLIEWLIQYGAPLTRIPEVLDVWMDSGSMPYAQMHYPFENKWEMESSFPADFIAEYVGQVRAWFYVMHVLGVLLNPNNEPKPTPSFTNVITTGVINGNDGRKMSKSYGNYPDPRATIEKYGADPIRFYMLNSPLLSGGDMDFKEEQIIETVKGVMLPLWNTYSFFTTYANIDNWTPDTTEVWFTRHGETFANASQRMSDKNDDSELNDIGKLQAKNAGKTLREQGKNFDIIIHTSRTRAKETAEIIAREIGFSGEFILDERFAEQDAWEFSGKTLTEVAEMVWLPPDTPHDELRRKYKENKVESVALFEERIISGYADILEKYRWKRVLIVAHAGTSRPILHKYFWVSYDDAYFDRRIRNAEPFRLMTTPLVNDLDRWILSKLQVLMGQVHDAMDGYDVSRACRAIVSYMDEMTNWYVRLSRRRFWESGMTDDKKSAYSTLHMVLAELSKLLAPYMPFLSEAIWKGLTDGSCHSELAMDPGNQEHGFFVPQNDENSVHLQYVTFPNRHLIDTDLNRDMEKCEHIVSLGLALRSQKNIRVRQSLQSVTITADLSEYYQNIIRDELNVKEIRLENPEKLAKKIAKPDAKKIGPKYGKDVQAIIIAAKNGEFTELEAGRLQVGNFILEAGEYTLEYLPLEGVGDVIWGYGMVLAMDTAITEGLKLEWYARDIIRLIQDMRKESDYNVTDRISLSIIGEKSDHIKSLFSDMIMSETLSTLVDQIDTPDTIREEEIDEDNVIQIAIKR